MLISILKKNFRKTFLEKNFKFTNVKAKILNDVIKDVDNYENFVPMCKKSEVVKIINSELFYGKLDIDNGIYQDSYTSKIICKKEKNNNSMIYSISSYSDNNKIFKYLRSHWKITEKNHITSVNYKLEYEMKNYLYASTTDILKGYIAKKTVNAMVDESIKKQKKLKNENSNCNKNWIFDLLEKFLTKKDFKHFEEILKNQKFANKIILLMNYFDSEKKLKQNETEFLYLFRDIYNEFKTEKIIN